MPNERKINQLFITLPRWPKYEELKTLCEFFPPTSYIKICEESHDSESLTENKSMIHYHIVLLLSHAITKKKFLLYVKGRFPDDYYRVDVAGVRNLTSSLTYLSKESLRVFEHGTLPLKKSAILYETKVPEPEVLLSQREISQINLKKTSTILNVLRLRPGEIDRVMLNRIVIFIKNIAEEYDLNILSELEEQDIDWDLRPWLIDQALLQIRWYFDTGMNFPSISEVAEEFYSL